MTWAQNQIGKSCQNFHQIYKIAEPSPGELEMKNFVLTRKSHQGFLHTR